ncbi:amino acid deaminase [Burkholderia sp. PU8-34]
MSDNCNLDNSDRFLGKGLGPMAGATDLNREGSHSPWNLLREDVSLPAAVLYADRLEHNLKWMQKFVTRYGLKLAPHGKTTMAPQLFQRQIDGGAWGITLATAHQVRAAYEGGVRHVLMANQLVGRDNMRLIAELLQDPSFEFYCLVDSPQGVEQLGAYFYNVHQRVNVLIELGVPGGRTGLRSESQIAAVLAEAERWPDSIQVAGVEFYEGVLENERAVRELVRTAIRVTATLIAEGKTKRSPAILSGAGSAWYDVVADELSHIANKQIEVILRPGCYLTHDVGVYRNAQEEIFKRNPVAKEMKEGLLPALQLWAYVQSIPDPDRAIIGFGKRDASFDTGMPEPARHYRPSSRGFMPREIEMGGAWKIFKMMDQHAYMSISPGDDIRIGDMISFDISHPCLTFDKWRHLLVVNQDYDVEEVVNTYF